MIRKYFVIVLVFLAGLIFLTSGMLTAEEAKTEAPEKVVIENPFGESKKGPVPFTHEKHVKDYKVACTECHHVYKDGKNVWKEGDPTQPCSTCHKEQKDGEVDNFQNALHKNCKSCHKDLEKEGKPTGPWKKCNDCHEKKA